MRGRLRSGGASVSFFAFQDIITSVIGIILFIALFLSMFIGMEEAETSNPEVRQPASPEEFAKLEALLLEISRLKARLADSISTDPSARQAEISALTEELAVLKAQAIKIGSESFIPTTANTEQLKIEIAGILNTTAENKARIEELKKQSAALASEAAELTRRYEELEAERLDEERRKNDIWLIPDRKDTSKKPLLVIANRDDFVVKTLDNNWTQSGEVRGSDLESLLKKFGTTEYFVVMYCRPSTFHVLENSLETVRSMGFDVGYDPIEENQDINFRASKP
jgi:hypothetical protein